MIPVSAAGQRYGIGLILREFFAVRFAHVAHPGDGLREFILPYQTVFALQGGGRRLFLIVPTVKLHPQGIEDMNRPVRIRIDDVHLAVQTARAGKSVVTDGSYGEIVHVQLVDPIRRVILPDLLRLLRIPYIVLKDDEDDFEKAVHKAVSYCRLMRSSYALIAPKGVMAGGKTNNTDTSYPMSREEAIEAVLDNMPEDTVYAATTGRATRELFFLRERRHETKAHDYLNVGSMGHASSVALGIALEKPDRKVVDLDGDSAAIMHMGALTMVSKLSVPNYMHIVLNNGANESVGGQPSAGYKIDFTKIAESCGYRTVGRPVETKEELKKAVIFLRDCGQASFIDCRIHKGLAHKLPPIVFDHREAIDELMEDLRA